jgi:hypothetical protein
MKATLIYLLVAFTLLGAIPARAEESASFEAMMILATNDRAPMDRRLEHVEYQLRRIFKFEYFRHLGGGQARINLPSDFALDLGQGHSLRVRARSHDGRVRADVQWMRDDKSVLNTTVSMKRGAHAILGGIPHEGGTLIVTLVAK